MEKIEKESKLNREHPVLANRINHLISAVKSMEARLEKLEAAERNRELIIEDDNGQINLELLS